MFFLKVYVFSKKYFKMCKYFKKQAVFQKKRLIFTAKLNTFLYCHKITFYLLSFNQ